MRLQKIDEGNRSDHTYLDEGDECYYALEYTPRRGFYFSRTNDRIINLKKPVDRRGRPEYRYKEQAITEAAGVLRSVLNEHLITTATFVPVPGSKTRNHALYDDRIVRVLDQMTAGLAADVRELVIQTEDLESFHDGCRLRPEELLRHYEIDEGVCPIQDPTTVCIFDDILTTGSHFKAVATLIHRRWPSARIVGIFIARRYIPNAEPEAELG